nr:hypothetical protein [Treponema socranskii]
MIIFRRLTTNSASFTYEFSGDVYGKGILEIDCNTGKVTLIDFAGDKRAAKKLVFIAQKKLQTQKYPEKCTYAYY